MDRHRNPAPDAPRALEFFAGIGLARLGLEAAGFRVVWSNDREPAKHRMYEAHFGRRAGHEYLVGDLSTVDAKRLPPGTALAWGSSPCTDLSLAGARAGIDGAESGAFWEYIRVLRDLGADRPRVAVLENVVGLATSCGGKDLAAAIRAFNLLGYSVDALTLDARRFVPQSRPRLFLVAALSPPPGRAGTGAELRPAWLRRILADPSLRTHQAPLPAPPPPLAAGLSCLVEELPHADATWWDEARTSAFTQSLTPIQRERVEQLRRAGGARYRTAYRRTRRGRAVWEVRPDDIAGCLRTARGGSSKQAIARLGDGELHIRWMTPREYAALMGARGYELSGARANQALFAFGDAVAAPVVEWLARHYLMPLATA
jgi:DNA (cytosine-5)-methyltransferase 1